MEAGVDPTNEPYRRVPLERRGSRSTSLPTARTALLVPKPAQINLIIYLHGPIQMAHGNAFTLTSPDRS